MICSTYSKSKEDMRVEYGLHRTRYSFTSRRLCTKQPSVHSQQLSTQLYIFLSSKSQLYICMCMYEYPELAYTR